MKIQFNRKTDTALRILVGIGIAMILFILRRLWFRITGCDILQSHPSISDEIGYWRELYSFSEHGWKFGCGGGILNETADWGHFGSHGLAPFFAWGWYARLFPWTPEALVNANFILLEISVIVFVLLVHDDLKDMIFSAVILLCWPYIFLYLCSSMMETACCAVMIIYTALFIRYRRKKTRVLFCLALLCILYLTCMRYCYAVAAFPLLWESCDYRIDKKTVVIMLIYALGTVLVYWFLTKFETTYPDYVIDQTDGSGLGGKIKLLWENFLLNVQKYFSFQPHQTSEFFHRIISVAAAALLCIRGLYGEDRRFYFSLGLVIFTLILLNLICYEIGFQKELRVMGPVLVFALLAAENGRGSVWLKTVIALAAAVGLVIGVKQIQGYGSRNEYNHFFMLERFSEMEDQSDVVRPLFDDEPAVAAVRVTETFQPVSWIPPQISIQWAIDKKDMKNVETEYVVAIAEEIEVPDDYILTGEPVTGFKVYRRNS